MSPRTLLSLANRKYIDLRNPQPEDIDFDVIAEHLAKEARYNGATPGAVYSVAQHCVIGVNVVAELVDNPADAERIAAYVLLHDGHEAYLRDDTTPKKNALAEEMAERFGILAPQIRESYTALTDRFDVAIHEAAGLAWPPPQDIADFVKEIDLRLFVTEWRDLMKDAPHPHWGPYRDVVPFTSPIVPRPWKEAKAAFLFWCRQLLPNLRASA